MNYYNLRIRYELKNREEKNDVLPILRKFNRFYSRRELSAKKLFIFSSNEEYIRAVLMIDCRKTSLKRAIADIEKECRMKQINYFKTFKILPSTAKEITLEVACNDLQIGIYEDYLERYMEPENLCCASYADGQVDFDEFLLESKTTSHEQAEMEGKSILADSSFFEELERIYSPLNKRRFYGNPVHYVINATSRETAKHMVDLLAKALYANKRIKSARITYVTKMDTRRSRGYFDELCLNSYASLVAVECKDSEEKENDFARDAQRLSEEIEENIKEYSSDVPFVLVNIGGSSKICKHCVGELIANDIEFIEISEGRGSKTEAMHYLGRLLKENHVPYAKEDFVLPGQEDYSVFDVYEGYRRIKSGSIKNSIYKAYKDCKKLKVEAPKSLSSSYDKLQNMVGLSEIKSIIDQVIAAHKINKLRKDMELEVANTAKHMIFTGNPGSAKTTVARLLASIFYDEHITTKSKFVECGRQDLVGKYVGWTAKQVEAKFREAKGGVLFIDEAYSLVDGSNSFGDEEINTIVQMMENYREDVIVIFAGYPDKMQRFLEKNEGLRSRIAFHIDFPDYNGEELCTILKLMTAAKGYTLEADAEHKCREIFDIACKNAEFGNGRFVRNVLEQAIIKQSVRIVDEYQGKTPDKSAISHLAAADFDINAAETYKAPKVAIGF